MSRVPIALAIIASACSGSSRPLSERCANLPAIVKVPAGTRTKAQQACLREAAEQSDRVAISLARQLVATQHPSDIALAGTLLLHAAPISKAEASVYLLVGEEAIATGHGYQAQYLLQKFVSVGDSGVEADRARLFLASSLARESKWTEVLETIKPNLERPLATRAVELAVLAAQEIDQDAVASLCLGLLERGHAVDAWSCIQRAPSNLPNYRGIVLDVLAKLPTLDKGLILRAQSHLGSERSLGLGFCDSGQERGFARLATELTDHPSEVSGDHHAAKSTIYFRLAQTEQASYRRGCLFLGAALECLWALKSGEECGAPLALRAVVERMNGNELRSFAKALDARENVLYRAYRERNRSAIRALFHTYVGLARIATASSGGSLGLAGYPADFHLTKAKVFWSLLATGPMPKGLLP
jgi:hypothetical protein